MIIKNFYYHIYIMTNDDIYNQQNHILIEGGGYPAFWYCLGYCKQYIKSTTPKFIAGYSAGSIVAVLLLLPDITLIDILEIYVNNITCCIFCSLESNIRKMMNILPNNTYKLANTKIGIILCEPRNNNKCKMVINWNSNEELIDCLVASCYNPCITNGIFSTVDNKYNCRDAIYSSNLQEFINNFNYTISKPTNELFISRFINNFIPLSSEKSLILYNNGSSNFLEN
tara:strand:+ start:45389 stop:46069 length:681 start_codon:yes stop_codon:yes gene_type:complete